MDIEERRIKHLEMIQGIVNRLAGNSFAVKGWSVTLVTALIAVAVGKSDGRYALAGLLPALIFWILDGYFLWQERLFRQLYDAVRRGEIDQPIDFFSMNTSLYVKHIPSWAKTAFAISRKKPNTLMCFHGAVIICILLAAKILT